MKKEERTTPKLRFPEFTDDWEKCKLGDVLEVSTRRNGNQFPKEDVLSVSDEYGCVNQIQFQGRSFAGEDISNYKVVDTGDIIYTRSPLRAKPFGIIKIVREETGIVSPLYIVNKAIDGNDAEFLYRVFDLPHKTNNYLSPLVRKGAKNTMNISEDEWLSGSVMISPFYEEQKKVGKFFKVLDDAITLHQLKLEQMQEYKRGMLQKLFPKKGETVPEVRFPGFTGDWEQRKVSEVADITTGGTPKTGVQSYWEPKEIPWLSSGEVHKKYINFTDNQISAEGMNNSSARMVKENSVLIALAGQGKTRGTVAINRIPLTTNQSIAAMTFGEDIVPEFVFCNLDGRYDEIRKMSSGDGARGGLNKQIVGDIAIPYTSKPEQEQIGRFFTNLDNLITLHQRKLDQMKEYKKGLLQQMFV